MEHFHGDLPQSAVGRRNPGVERVMILWRIMFQKLVDRMVLRTVAFFFGMAVTVLRRIKRA